MLPLFFKNNYNINTIFKTRIKKNFKIIISDKRTRNLFIFLLLNFSFAFIELIYGVWTNSLGLVSDSFHMFFDSTGLIAALVASIITKWHANDKYSFGYARAEVLAGFVNGFFLLFIALFIFLEAVERIFQPPEVKYESVFVVSIFGFLINLIGIWVFQQHGLHGHSHNVVQHEMDFHKAQGDVISSSGSHLMRGVFLHILADTLGSVGIIVSSILMQTYGWMRTDAVCSILIAILIIASVSAFLKESVFILMQRQPAVLDKILPGCYQKVLMLHGVNSIQEPRFWTLTNNYYIGEMKLEVSEEADAGYIITQTQIIFTSVGVKQICVQLDYPAA